MRSILLFFLCLFFVFAFGGYARAEEPGATTQQPTATQQQQQQNQNNGGGGEKTETTARKEEDEPKSWSITAIKGYLKSKAGLQNSVDAKDKQIADLQARVKTLEDGTALKALQEENAQMRADLEGMAEYAQANGLFEEKGKEQEPPKQQSEAGKIANGAINRQVAKELRSIGHDPKKLPAANGGGKDGKDAPDMKSLTPLQLIALGRQQALQSRSAAN